MVIAPTLTGPDDGHLGVVVWRWPDPVVSLSSAPVGGGLGRLDWLLNIGVSLGYDRTDLADHAGEVAAANGLAGDGAALFTAAEVADRQRASSDGVVADATVGISKPTWAADPSGGWSPFEPGTINVVIQVPVVLEVGAAVNAVITATESKTQALLEAGVPGTGTASDALVVTWPSGTAGSGVSGYGSGRAEAFAGPRSTWGSRVAAAVNGAVAAGIERWRG